MNTGEPWFYCADIPEIGFQLVLDERESRHAGGSRRLRPGDKLNLFDGKGVLAETAFVEKSKKGIRLDVLTREQHQLARKSIHLACPIPKGDRVGVLLDMATQVGMTDFTPLISEHGLNERITEAAQQRWQRIVIEACKQSRRLFLPQIHEAQKLETLVQNVGRNEQQIWLADANGDAMDGYLQNKGTSSVSNLLLVGPEGGFSESEIDSARKNKVALIRLSDNVLRVETAAVLLVSILS